MTNSKERAHRKVGRPSRGLDVVTTLRISPELAAALDQWAAKRSVPTRSEAVRQVLEQVLFGKVKRHPRTPYLVRVAKVTEDLG